MKKINFFRIIILLLVFSSAYVGHKFHEDNKSGIVTALANIDNLNITSKAEDIQKSNSNNYILNLNINNEVSKHNSITIYNHLGEASGALFTYEASGLWQPGIQDKKTAYISSDGYSHVSIYKIIFSNFEINDSQGRKISKNTKEYGDFIDNMRISIFNNNQTECLADSTFREVIEKGATFRSEVDVPSGGNNKLNFIVSMDEKAGNSLQGLQCKFDISYSFKLINIADSSEKPLPETGPNMDEIITAFLGIMLISVGKLLIASKRINN